MTIIEFETEEEMERHSEYIEELNYKHNQIKDEILSLQTELERKEDELYDFQQENKEYLI